MSNRDHYTAMNIVFEHIGTCVLCNNYTGDLVDPECVEGVRLREVADALREDDCCHYGDKN